MPADDHDPLSPGDHYADLNGLNFHYKVAGQGPVMIVPSAGWGIGVESLAELEPLKEHFKLVFFDTRGSGESERPEGPREEAYGFKNLVLDLEALRTHLGQEKIGIIGHSLGSVQAMTFAAAHPGHVDSLILIGATPNLRDEAQTAAVMKALERVQSEPWFPKAMESMGALTTPEQTAVMSDKEMAAHYGNLGPLYFYDTSKAAEHSEFIGGQQYNAQAMYAYHFAPPVSEEQLGRIQVPTLIVRGDGDIVTTPEESEHLHEHIAGSRLVTLEETAHFPWTEKPEAFLRAVEDNLAYLSGGPAASPAPAPTQPAPASQPPSPAI